MFSSGMREAQRGNDIVIQDTSPAAFRALLLYLYTDELAFDDTLLVDVLRKAKEVDLTRVYTHCERRCERELSTQKAVLWFCAGRRVCDRGAPGERLKVPHAQLPHDSSRVPTHTREAT